MYDFGQSLPEVINQGIVTIPWIPGRQSQQADATTLTGDQLKLVLWQAFDSKNNSRQDYESKPLF
ncbi:MAG: hypothetical protein V7L29_06160 [Nostoc sp.]|uniref:hypothetical protein n=1 Tax=Nostoc sp. TaxID=1180 RepID=UPI002FF37F1B